MVHLDHVTRPLIFQLYKHNPNYVELKSVFSQNIFRIQDGPAG